jgi:C4-dicarboxylate-specific signal transduction histidine kinase
MSPETGPDEVIALNRLATVARVLAGTAHDVNNALQIIGGSAELLENQPGLTDGAKRALARIRAQAARAGALLDDLSQFAKDRPEGSTRVRLRDVVGQAAAFRGWRIRRAGTTLTFDRDGASPVDVMAKRSQLLQALINVIIDAEQALEGIKGGSITLLVIEDGDNAVVQVRNSGPDRIDQAAQRGFGDPENVSSSAALNGLTAARLIARTHGGELTLDPVQTGGSVTLRLPRAR